MTAVLAGAAAHNAGEYGIARAIWAGEAPVDPPGDDADDPLRDALGAFATTVVEGRRGAWDSALDAAVEAVSAIDSVDAAESADTAAERADTASADRVDTAPIERWLAAFRADPELAERAPPPTLAVDGDRPTPSELPLAAAAVVAEAVAAARGDDPEILADALRYAREGTHPESTRYATFVRDYAAAAPGQRPTVFARLSGLVERQRRKEDDVSGLFDGA